MPSWHPLLNPVSFQFSSPLPQKKKKKKKKEHNSISKDTAQWMMDKEAVLRAFRKEGSHDLSLKTRKMIGLKGRLE